MIENEKQYEISLAMVEKCKEVILHTRRALEISGYNSEEIERGIAPVVALMEGIQDELSFYVEEKYKPEWERMLEEMRWEGEGGDGKTRDGCD